MKVNVEISLYVLSDTYKDKVMQFLVDISQRKEIQITFTDMSTQLRGEYTDIMSILTNQLKEVIEQEKVVVLIKMTNTHHDFKKN